MTSAFLTHIFPKLLSAPYKITSPEDVRYNCVAWAAGVAEIHRRWWPAPSPFYYWPLEPREETLEAFIQAFGLFGFVPCESSDVEPDFDKLAIYADHAGTPTHMTRQLPLGGWTSKLGELEDIHHTTLEQLTGSDYGQVAQILKRKRPTS